MCHLNQKVLFYFCPYFLLSLYIYSLISQSFWLCIIPTKDGSIFFIFLFTAEIESGIYKNKYGKSSVTILKISLYIFPNSSLSIVLFPFSIKLSTSLFS